MIGYFLGRRDNLELPELKEKIKKKIRLSKIDVGAVKRPTSQDLAKKKDPLEAGIEETRLAFKNLGVDK